MVTPATLFPVMAASREELEFHPQKKKIERHPTNTYRELFPTSWRDEPCTAPVRRYFSFRRWAGGIGLGMGSASMETGRRVDDNNGKGEPGLRSWLAVEFTGTQREDSTCSNQSLSYTRKQYIINASWIVVARSPLKRLLRCSPAARATSQNPASSAICFKEN
jgi:hypothetical protein